MDFGLDLFRRLNASRAKKDDRVPHTSMCQPHARFNIFGKDTNNSRFRTCQEGFVQVGFFSALFYGGHLVSFIFVDKTTGRHEVSFTTELPAKCQFRKVIAGSGWLSEDKHYPFA